jgi:hypothetical protein
MSVPNPTRTSMTSSWTMCVGPKIVSPPSARSQSLTHIWVVVLMVVLTLRRQTEGYWDRNRNLRLCTGSIKWRTRPKRWRRRMKMPRWRRGCRGSHGYRPSVRRSSKRNYYHIRSHSTTRGTHNRYFYAKKSTSWPVNLKRTSYSKRNASSRRIRSRRSFKTSWW